MKSHQIIQTSCRRGITGGGSGFQVYSCDESLAQRGFLNGAEYQKLFVYDTPVEVGVPSFGYAYVEEIGSVFSLNTRLAHDFGGVGTRSGNLLNHSIVVDGGADFYPAEFFGTPLLRSSLLEEEANSDDTPGFLPILDCKPSGSIDREDVGDWLDDYGGAEAIERLLGAYIRARAEEKALIILDTPTNVIRWIAALEYCLPLRQALKINFVTYSENAASVRANIAGTSREQFERNTPAYMFASLCVFDPSKQEEHPLPVGPFIDFVDISYSLNPLSLAKFSQFVDADIEFGDVLSLEALEQAYAAYSIIKDPIEEWAPSVIKSGLRYAQTKGGNELNERIVQIIEGSHEALNDLDSDSQLEILEYLIRRWPLLDASGKKFVEDVVVSSIMGILQDRQTEDAVFQHYFEAFSKACASAGLNIFEILMGDASRKRLIEAAQGLSASKLKLLALSLTEFVLASKQPYSSLLAKAPLGSLYVSLLRCAFAQGAVVGTGLAQSIVAAASAELRYMENLIMTIDWAVKSSYRHAAVQGPPDEQVAIDSIWDYGISCVVAQHASEVHSAVKWLIWAADYDQSRYQYLLNLYDQMITSCRSTTDAMRLYECFSPEDAKSNAKYMANAYSYITSRYIRLLQQMDDEEALQAQRSLLEKSLGSNTRLDFVPTLMETVSQDFGIKRTAPADVRLMDKAIDYEYRTGGLALTGRAALIDAVLTLESARQSAEPSDAIGQLEGQSASLNLSVLDDRAYKDYAKRLAPACMDLVMDGQELARIIEAYSLYGQRLSEFLNYAFTYARKSFDKTGRPTALVALITYCATTTDGAAGDACVSALSGIKSEDDLYYLDDMTTRSLHNLRDVNAVNQWKRMFAIVVDKRGRGFFRRFRR